MIDQLVKLRSTEANNGATNATLVATYVLRNPIPVNGFVYLRLPKVTKNYKNRGALVQAALVTGADAAGGVPPPNTAVKVASGAALSALADKTVVPMQPAPNHFRYSPVSTTSENFDDVTAYLANTSPIAASTEISLTIFPITNPPS